MTLSIDALRRRRTGYARYAELILAQIEAIDADDLDRFQALAEERDELARRIDADQAPDAGGYGAGEGELAMNGLGSPSSADRTGDHAALEVERLLGEVRLLLERCREHDDRLRQKLVRLRDEARESIHELERRRPHVQGYMPSRPGRPARVDVRL